MLYNERFPVLSTVAKILFFVGVLELVIGLCSGGLLGKEFLKLAGNSGAKWSFETKDIIRMVVCVFGILGGLFTMATAESIGVLFGIEKNTRVNQ
jgi:hypothetical protein